MPFPELVVDGYRSFRSGRLAREQDRYRELAESGQKPDVMVIGCCDSRVSPEVIFDARPGELLIRDERSREFVPADREAALFKT